MIAIGTLQPAQPYNFALLLDILSRFAYPTLDYARDGAYWRVLRVGGTLVLVRVTAGENGDLNIHSVGADTQNKTPVIDALTRVLPLDINRAGFEQTARADAQLWSVVEPLIGLPEWRTASLWEGLAQAIIEQQIAWVAAQKAQHWLVEWAGNCIEHEGHRYYAFPTPAQIAAATVEDLKPLKITFKRMALLIEVAQQVENGVLDLESLRDVEADTAYQRLLSIKGIGHWTAAVALGRAFGHGYVTHNDVALQAAVNRYFYGGTGRIPAEQLIATFAPYGEHAATAAHYTLMRWVLDMYPRVENR
ncbi:MAG: hypothetical protein K8L97_11450 [Anaerolineae bacterium]|nr:hypothetical protein [Anaerolineae bacterium]